MKNSTESIVIHDDAIPFDRPTFVRSSTAVVTADEPWYHHPDRPCAGREEFQDLSLIPRRGRKAIAKRMQRECYGCPVLKECRIDYLATTSHHDMYGVRAGIIGKV